MSTPFGTLPTGSLIIKASCDERLKRLAFGPPLDVLKHAEVKERVAEILQFDESTSFAMCWNDDDGETCEIESDADLREALIYHAPSDPSRMHETVTMRVFVRIDATIDFSDFSSNSSAFGRPVKNNSRSVAGSVAASFYRPPLETSAPSFYDPSEIDTDEDEARSAWASTSSASVINKPSSAFSTSEWSYIRQGHARQTDSFGGSSRDDLSADYQPRSEASNDSAIEILEESWERARIGEDRPHSATSNGLDLLSWRNALPSRSRSSSSSSGSDATEAGRSPRSNVAALDALRLQSGMLPHYAGQAPHTGITCSACGIQPIRGARYHCTECPEGVDLCTPCEAAMHFASEAGHSASHAMLKINAPVSSVSAASALGTALMSTQQRLYAEAASAGLRREPAAFQQRSDSTVNTLRIPGDWNNGHVAEDRIATCDYCNGDLENVRFLCANCPLNINHGEGYNLCRTCERHSFQCHDPAHFFLKIRIPRAQPARLRLDAHLHDFREPLLPTLYKETTGSEAPSSAGSRGNGSTIMSYRTARELFARGQRGAPSSTSQSSGASNTPSPNAPTTFAQRQLPDLSGSIRARIGHWGRQLYDEYELRQLVPSGSGSAGSADISMALKRQNLVPVESLVHPSTMCDGCYEVISGPWLRCCNCPASYDICEACEARLGHNPRHAFAVFKQPLDLDLFRSAVDMEDNRANRPLLPFLLV